MYFFPALDYFFIFSIFSRARVCMCVSLSACLSFYIYHFILIKIMYSFLYIRWCVTLNVTAVYLCKRTMQNKTRLELADYEAENLARLQKMFSRKWEFIFMQAEAQSKVDKKRDKLERKVLDSQERAFWDVHRPMVRLVSLTRNCIIYTTVSCNTRVACLRNNFDALPNYISAWVREHYGAGY